jgi:hypothetical protein
VGDQHAGPDLVEERRDGVGRDLGVERSGVRHHLPEILIQGLRVARELHTREELRPATQAKHVEPALIVRGGADNAGHRASRGAAAPWLIDQVDREAATQEQRLEAFAAVRRGLPGLAELPEAVPHHERQPSRVRRHLVEDPGVVAMQGLALGTWPRRVVGARAADHGAAHREAALLLDHERRLR